MRRIFKNNFKLLVFLLAVSFVMSSKQCGNGQPGPTQPYTNVTLSIASYWPANFPQAWFCGQSGPTFNNNPRFHVGTCSYYTETTKRFTEVIVRKISDNSEFDRKCWGPNASQDLIVKVPNSSPYEIKFKQYDGCSSSCMQSCNGGTCRPIRMIWEYSQTFSYPTTYVNVAPHYDYNTFYTVCN